MARSEAPLVAKMKRQRIKPTDTVPVILTDQERKLILDKTFAGPNLTNRFRVALSTQDGIVVRYTLDDLDELLGYIAAEANHCANKRLQKSLDKLYEKVRAVLESYTDEDPEDEPDDEPEMPPVNQEVSPDGILNDDQVEYVVSRLKDALGATILGLAGDHGVEMAHIIRFSSVAGQCRTHREARGLTIKEVAGKLKCTQYRIKDIEENHIRHVEGQVLKKYIEFLELNDWFDRWVDQNDEFARSLLG